MGVPKMKQQSFGSLTYRNKKKRAKREGFLAEMDRVVPWGQLLKLIEPH